MALVTVGEDEGRTALLIDGVVQSVVVVGAEQVDGYWAAMLPNARPSTALLLGLGGGTIATLLTRRFGRVAITAVEHNAEVIQLAHELFGLDGPGIDIVVDDAFDYVRGMSGGHYDYIAVDLFEAGRVPPRIFGRPFLRALRSLTHPGGLVAVNFFKDRRLHEREQRLESVFPRVTFSLWDKNVVALCRPR